MKIEDLPNPGIYVRLWRAALANPNKRFEHFDWTRGIVTGLELSKDFSKALQNRINSRGGLDYKHYWRKYDGDYQSSIRRAAGEINTPRLLISYLPPDLRKRFAHRLFTED